MKKETRDVIVIGFALFSIFFGAGNLMFPPYLGMVSGQNWFIAFLGFIIADAGLSLLVILAATKGGGTLDEIMVRGGKKLARLLGCLSILCIGPFLAIPRTAATTFEMSILPFAPNLGLGASVGFSIVFFILTLVLTIRPTKVMDIVGKILTPILIICLIALIIKGAITPLGPVNPEQMIDRNLFSEGISQGYLTMDALGAAALATIMLNTWKSKGYEGEKKQVSLTLKAGLVSGLCLAIVYGGLTFLGSTLSMLPEYGLETSQALLVVAITGGLFGEIGKILLAIMVAFACLTTSIGLTSAASEYFAKISNGKISYEKVVVIISVFSAVVSNFGVTTIIQFSIPILQVIFPGVTILVLMSLFTDKIKNNNSFKFAAYLTLLTSLLLVINSINGSMAFITKLPFAAMGFGWLIPGLIGAIIGNFVGDKKEA